LKDHFKKYLNSKEFNFDLAKIKMFEVEKKGMEEENCNNYLNQYKEYANNLLEYYKL